MLNTLNLRGPIFENVGKYLLRRTHKNNFIFRINSFDSFEEIIKKYRLNLERFHNLETFLKINKCRTDLVEFVFDNKLPSENIAKNVSNQRIVEKIIFYDVKSRRQNTQRKYFEECISNHEFITLMKDEFGCNTKIVSIILFENWRFSFNEFNYNDVLLRVYNSQEKRTLFFSKKT